MSESILQLLEGVSVILNLGFIILLSKRSVWCWPIGIIGSFISAFVVYQSHYYSETILYLFYALVGIYAWIIWSRHKEENRIRRLSLRWHALWVFFGFIITWILGAFMVKLDADHPYYDAFSSVFGVIATFLEMYRYLGGWIYWILLNMYSIVLYAVKDLWMLSAQMIIFTVLSVYGFIEWRKNYLSNTAI